MLEQVEGSHAVASAVALCRPQVICAYPITPQTHIVEGLGEMVKSGQLQDCEYINVESEFAALSVGIGSSAAADQTGRCSAARASMPATAPEGAKHSKRPRSLSYASSRGKYMKALSLASGQSRMADCASAADCHAGPKPNSHARRHRNAHCDGGRRGIAHGHSRCTDGYAARGAALARTAGWGDNSLYQ